MTWIPLHTANHEEPQMPTVPRTPPVPERDPDPDEENTELPEDDEDTRPERFEAESSRETPPDRV